MINVNDQYSVQVFSALENDLISLSPSDGLGNVMNGGGGGYGRPMYSRHADPQAIWKLPVA